jgi:hypothetical protein
MGFNSAFKGLNAPASQMALPTQSDLSGSQGEKLQHWDGIERQAALSCSFQFKLRCFSITLIILV